MVGRGRWRACRAAGPAGGQRAGLTALRAGGAGRDLAGGHMMETLAERGCSPAAIAEGETARETKEELTPVAPASSWTWR